MAGRLALDAGASHANRKLAESEFGVWSVSAPALPPLPRLDGPIESEVAIIGAGYTGLSTALHLAEAGTPAVLLEAGEPGSGASGRTTGWLEPNWWLATPRSIAAMHGAQRGAELSRWVASGPKLLKRWVTEYRLEIEPEQSGILLATSGAAKAQALESEARDWQALGVDNDYLDGAAVAQHVPTRRYCGGLLLREGTTVNPLALSRELARACLLRNTRLFVESPVKRIVREHAAWRLETPRGRVRCNRLVLATDAYTRDLWPALTAAFATWQVAVIASKTGAGVRDLLPRNAAFGDLSLGNLFTLRSARGDRLVSSTFAPLWRRSRNAALLAQPFMRKFRSVFPDGPAPTWQYAHFGEIGLSRDMLPRLCAIGPDAWTAYGYSGTGMNLALLLGGELAALAQAGETVFPVTSLAPRRGRALTSFVLNCVYAPIARHLTSRFA
jgi:glycine/D-amino acid oxidase-like deaminating enzyme